MADPRNEAQRSGRAVRCGREPVPSSGGPPFGFRLQKTGPPEMRFGMGGRLAFVCVAAC